MGWLFLNPAPLTPKAYLDNQCTYAPDPGKGRDKGLRVLKSAVRSSVYYAACQYYDAAATYDTFAVVCLTKWNPAARDGLTLGYKDMDERMGPYQHGCPASILDLLSPTDHQYASEWRTKCRAQLVLTSRRKPNSGDTIILSEPLSFSDGVADTTFTATQHRSRLAFRRKTDNQLVTISNFMNRQWKIVPALAVSR